MTSRYWPLLLTLASLWEASYLFIKVGVDGRFSPGALMTARTLIAAAVLFAYLMATIGTRTAGVRLREAWREAIALGFLNAAAPFWLIAWGEQHIDSGAAGIAPGAGPIFSLLVGVRVLPPERIRAPPLGGGCPRLVGVGVVAGGPPRGGAGAGRG